MSLKPGSLLDGQDALPENTLVFATHNSWKLKEFRDVCASLIGKNLTIVSSGEWGLAEPEENESSFEAQALMKARAAAKASGRIALADDSGFCVSALHNQPGLHSARWGGPERNMQLAIDRVYRELSHHPDRSAHFICVPALARPDGQTDFITERLHGSISSSPRGDIKFGYGCIFIPAGRTETFAELDPKEQQAINPRMVALKKLVAKHFALT